MALLLGSCRHLLRFLLEQVAPPQQTPKAGECMASLQLYRTEDRCVRAVPTRRPVQRKGDAA